MRPADEYLETAEWEVFGAASAAMMLACGQPEPDDVEYTIDAMKTQLERAEKAMRRYRASSSSWPRSEPDREWWKEAPC